jgi:hypothetical protein
VFAPLVAKPTPKSAQPQRSAAATQCYSRSATAHDNEEGAARIAAAEPAPAPSWDFSKVAVFSSGDEWLQAPPPFTAPRLPGAIQRKLKVGAVDDPLEHEADRVADQVIRTPAPEISAAAPPQVSRKCAGCEEEEKLQKKAAGPQAAGSEAPPLVHEVVRSPGQPLDAETRGFFELRFGHDFSRVRVHTGASAEQSARAVNAHAYTVRNNMVFGAGQFAPGTQEGRRLLAHELTHVVQQSASGTRTGHIGLPPNSPQPFANVLTRAASQREESFSTRPIVQRQAAAPAPAAAETGGLTEEMLKQIARTLHAAMEGWGTDEDAIYSAFSGRTQDQVDAIARVYHDLYRADLLADLRDELNDSEMAHLAIFSPTAAPGKPGSPRQAAALADEIAHQLNEAMDRVGTDENSIYAALTGRTQDELRAIKAAYKHLTNRELEADIRDEMSGSELTRALALLNQGVLLPEDEAYLAMKGAGTDEETLLRVLESVKGDRAKITDLIDKFAAKGYGNLLERVNDELSGSDLDKALEALHGQTPSGACSQSQREQALEAISLAAAMAQNAASRADADLAANKLSGAMESALRKYFNPGNAPNAVNLALLRQVRDALTKTRTDILSFSNVVCVTQNDGHCVTNPDCSSFIGAWTLPSARATVRMCPGFFSCDKDRPTHLLHEFCHHLGIRDLNVYYDQAGYSSLTPIGDGSVHDSLSKADAYAHFAKELF